jgi:hypothetical protein
MASSGSTLGIILQQGALVSSQVFDLDAGTPSGLVSYSNTQVLAPVAIAACGTGFAFVYEVAGGDILLQGLTLSGTPIGRQPTRLANLNSDGESIAMASTGAGALIAVSTGSQIAVYSVACP